MLHLMVHLMIRLDGLDGELDGGLFMVALGGELYAYNCWCT